MYKHLTPRFVALYLLLGVVLAASIAGAFAAYQMPTVKHDVKIVKASLGDQDLGKLANEYVTRIAAAQGFTVKKLDVLNVVKKDDAATVTCKVELVDASGTAQSLKLNVTFKRGVWTATNAIAA